jgi:hypothetical protein
MKVRIKRVPPTRILEGIDLRPYGLREGAVHDLEPRVAKLLILWDYAEPERDGAPAKKRDN